MNYGLCSIIIRLLRSASSSMKLLAFCLFLLLSVTKGEQVPRPRLINGPVPFAGTVQVYHGGSWHYVCGDSWDRPTANVTCRQLGFQDGALISLKGFPFGGDVIKSNKTMKFFVIRCNGMESSLVLCANRSLSTNMCSKGLANVVCRNASTSLNDTSVRLRGANASHAGRVEVRYAGIWGLVCGQNWDQNEAQVVCRQLGYQGALDVAVTSQSIFGKGTGPVWLDIDCQGDEKSLGDCAQGRWKMRDCSEDASGKTFANVICTTDKSIETVRVRLLGATPYSGQVQVQYNGLWGAVLFSGWDFKDGHVICQQLGFTGLASVYEETPYSPGEGMVWLADVQCTGKESSISNCSHPDWGSPAIQVSEATAGVQCYTNESAGDFTFRLQGSESPNAGRVEVLIKGEWGTVCDHSWDLHDARVVCRQLGFPEAVISLSGSTFGEGTGPGLMDYIRCTGLESSLAHCRHRRTKSCGVRSVAGVVCYSEDKSLLEVALRLRTKSPDSPNAGRVEARVEGAWGTVCRSGFKKVDADVVCRQLGYHAALEILPDSVSFGQGAGPIWFSRLGCTGNETGIRQCLDWGKTVNCSHSDDVAIVCQIPQPNKTENFGDVYVLVIIEMNIAQWNVTAFKVAVATALTEHCSVMESCLTDQTNQSEMLQFKPSDVHILPGSPNVRPGVGQILVNVSVMRPNIEPSLPITAEHLVKLLMETSRDISQRLGHKIVQVNETQIQYFILKTTQTTGKVLGAKKDKMPTPRPGWVIATAILLPILLVLGTVAIMHLACCLKRNKAIAKDDKDVQAPLREIKT